MGRSTLKVLAASQVGDQVERLRHLSGVTNEERELSPMMRAVVKHMVKDAGQWGAELYALRVGVANGLQQGFRFQPLLKPFQTTQYWPRYGRGKG